LRGETGEDDRTANTAAIAANAPGTAAT
jgi:hypothetical protein